MTTDKVDPDPLIGKRFGSYEIHERIGAGGMGIVYRAYDITLDRDVALKILSPALSSDAEFEQRFLREARAVAKLDHPNIVQVYAAARVQTHLFMAMQFIEGQTLDSILEQRNILPPEEALEIVRQVAEALKTAHEQGLIHRDIKPSNIMVERGGRVRLMDFGLARSFKRDTRLTHTDAYLGTPEYSSPEQCVTVKLDARTDLYSLGVVLYRMLTGQPPHAAETPMALFQKITQEDPAPVRRLNPQIPEGVAQLAHRMMMRDLDQRIQTAAEIATESRSLVARIKLEAARSRRTRRMASDSSPSSRVVAALAVTALVALAMALAWSSRGRPNAPPSVPTPAIRSSGGDDSPPSRANPSTVTATTPAAVDPVSLLVLDFRNGTGSGEHSWMEIGLADLLSRTLRQAPALQVPLRSELLKHLRQQSLGDAVTEELLPSLVRRQSIRLFLSGIYYVVTGKVRVVVELHDLRHESSQMETAQFERSMDDFFPLLDEVAAWVTQQATSRGTSTPATSTGGPVLSSAIEAEAVLPGPQLAQAGPARDLQTRGLREEGALGRRTDHTAGEFEGKLESAPGDGGMVAGAADKKDEDRQKALLAKAGSDAATGPVSPDEPQAVELTTQPARKADALTALGSENAAESPQPVAGGLAGSASAPDRGEKNEKKEKSAARGPDSAFDLARLRYAPQQMLERGHMGSETIERLFQTVHSDPEAVKLLERLGRIMAEQVGQIAFDAWMDFVCPACDLQRDGPGRCSHCDQTLDPRPNLQKIKGWMDQQPE